ncbi:hypothetical protein ABBQ38_005370 [Trebouxia sp. C0009 RCD-2024]
MAKGKPQYDAIVIGVGGMGSAALYQLARRGTKVLGIEQYGVAHNLGSSHGISRIIRLAYHEDPAYVPLLKRAYELWQQLEQETKQDLLCITGSIDTNRGDIEGYNGFKNALLSAKQHNLEHEVLTGDQVNARFPGYNLPSDFMAVYQPQGGILASELCIAAHIQAAQSHGAEFQSGEKVESWEVDPSSGIVTVFTDRGRYTASKLVLTAGAWMPDIMPELQSALVVERQVIGWFSVKHPDPDCCTPSGKFPVFLLQDEEDCWYGFPQYGHNGLKIGKFDREDNAVAHPSQLERRVLPQDEQMLRGAISRFFPVANHEMTKAATCMFTTTRDRHFIVDLHPTYKQVVVCSACSGHGYKFCSVMGEVLADLALTGNTRHDIEFIRFNDARPGQKEMMHAFHQGGAPVDPAPIAFPSKL